MAHPDVVEASVIGVPDDTLGRAPARVRRAQGRARPSTRPSCASSSASSVATWQLPERWAFIDEVPKTSVGKFDKKVLRAAARRAASSRSKQLR